MDDMTRSESFQARRSGFFTKSRAAVSLLFLMNGFTVGCWAPKIPEFAERLQLSKFELGLMILVFGFGSLVMMPIAGAQIAGRGSKIVVKAFAVLLLPMLLALTITQSVWTAAIAIFLFGGFIAYWTLGFALEFLISCRAATCSRSSRSTSTSASSA